VQSEKTPSKCDKSEERDTGLRGGLDSRRREKKFGVGKHAFQFYKEKQRLKRGKKGLNSNRTGGPTVKKTKHSKKKTR